MVDGWWVVLAESLLKALAESKSKEDRRDYFVVL
jgi:hypothetical protein